MEPLARRYEAPRQATTSSNDYNDFQDLVVNDIQRLASEITSNDSRVDHAMQYLIAEMRSIREEMEMLKKRDDLLKLTSAQNNESFTYFQDWSRTKDISFGEGTASVIPVSRRMRIDTNYGQVTVPFNNLVDRLFYRDLDTNLIVTDPNVTVIVTGTHEVGATRVIEGTPTNCVSSVDESYWVREVLYQPKEDIDYVECEIEIVVPTSRIITNNMLVIHPYPVGTVDIIKVEYSTDSGPANYEMGTDLAVYPNISFPINDAPLTRLVFANTEITRLKITLRQRGYTNRNGYKSFQYGLQEVALRLVDYDKTALDPTTDPNPTNIHSIITKIESAPGYVFDYVSGFWSSPITKSPSFYPNFFTNSNTTNWPVLYRIYIDEDLTTNIWDSYSSPLPQDTAVAVPGRVDTLYVVTSAAFDETRGVPPVLDYFGMKFTMES